MLVNFTNHTGAEISNHLGTVIQFELSGAIDKTLDSTLSSQFGETFLISKESNGASLSVVYMGQISGEQTKEIKMNDFGRDPAFIFTNHTGAQITNHLSEFIHFTPLNGIKTTFDFNSSAQLHKLIDAVMSNSFSITAEVAHHIVMNSAIEYSALITGSQIKERYLSAELFSSNDLNGVINSYRNLDAEIKYNTNLNALIMRRVGWIDCVIIKFKES